MTDSPGTRPKWRGLTVSTEYPSESAVAPIRRSANGITTPRFLLLGVQLARKLCDVCRQRIDGHGGKELLDEGLSACPPFGRISTVDPMRELNDTDCR